MKRLAFALTLLAAPLAAQDVGIPHTSFTLPNGLRVLVSEDRSTPIVSTNLLYQVGSIHEQPGRTGFAHLFEHVMFEGSRNIKEGELDDLLSAAGANYNAGTSSDWTAYFITLPSNQLELALWAEADRLGGLLQAVDQRKLDTQRDVVKNERRQRYENQPYGMFQETMATALYPAGVPYSWTTIGSMEDLSAASLDDVSSFFRRHYVPSNAVLSIVGDVDPVQARQLVERYFGWIPGGTATARPQVQIPGIAATRYLTREDRVTLPQVNLAWRTVPAYSDDSWAINAMAQVLAGGKNSRLYKRLVYDEKTAQSVSASNNGQLLSGDFFVRVTARPDGDLSALEAKVLEEIARLAQTPPTREEMDRVQNGLEMAFVAGLATSEGKAFRLGQYAYYAGRPDFAAEDLRRARAVSPADVQRVARQYLHDRNRIVLSFVPQGKTGLAAGPKETAR